MAHPNALAVAHISKSFGDIHALSDISLELAAGKIACLLGPSGCGKTTLLRIVAGLETADRGEVLLFGNNVAALPPQARDVGMVFQQYALWPHMTVQEHLRFALESKSLDDAERKKRETDILRITRLEKFRDRYPRQLSGGQQQRVSLARALVLQPKILLLDEPLSNLDTELRSELRDQIRHLNRELNLTMLFVTHEQEEALAIADWMFLLEAGRLRSSGTPEDLYRRPPNLFTANFLGKANILPIEEKEGQWLPRSASVTGETPGPFAVFRPETLRFEGSSNDWRFPGRVESRNFFGSKLEHRVKLENGRSLTLRTPLGSQFDPKEGEAVDVFLAFEALTIVQEA